MPNDIARDEVRRLLDSGALALDVLPASEYEESHLPGALNIPLEIVDAHSTKQLSKDKLIIAYCHDTQ